MWKGKIGGWLFGVPIVLFLYDFFNGGHRDIIGIFLVAAPEGIEKMQEKHPEVDIYVAAIEDHLNDKEYIMPGLGVAGDKIFGSR